MQLTMRYIDINHTVCLICLIIVINIFLNLQVKRFYKVLLHSGILMLLMCIAMANANAQLLEGKGKLKTANKEKRVKPLHKPGKDAKPDKEGREVVKKEKVRYSKKTEYKSSPTKTTSGSTGFKDAPRPKVKYGKKNASTKREEVNPKYSPKSNSTKRENVDPKYSKDAGSTRREAVYPKYSRESGSTKREEVYPKYSKESGSTKREEVYPKYSKDRNSEKRVTIYPRYSKAQDNSKRVEVNPRYSIRGKVKREEVHPLYSVREKPERIEVNPRYSKDQGYERQKNVVPRSISGSFKREKYDVSPRYSIHEPFEQKKRQTPLSISGESMVYDNTKERRKNAVKNDPIYSQFKGFDKKESGPNTKGISKQNSEFAGFNRAERKNNSKAVSADYSKYEGPYAIKPLKRKSNMHPSAAYLGGEDMSNRKVKKIKREFNILWVRLNGNKNIPDNVRKQDKEKPKRDKKEGDIWVY